jgi:hypothetical protein
LSWLFSVVLALLSLGGCGGGGAVVQLQIDTERGDLLSVVVVVFLADKSHEKVTFC